MTIPETIAGIDDSRFTLPKSLYQAPHLLSVGVNRVGQIR